MEVTHAKYLSSYKGYIKSGKMNGAIKKHACFLPPDLPYFFPKKCHSLHIL